MSLFDDIEKRNLQAAQPLPARMRPASLDEFVGQQHFLGEGKLLRRLLAADRMGSVLFYGPPGCGKTTLARLLATESRRRFRQLSAITSGVKELRQVLSEARDQLETGGKPTLLFVDEIHRFNKTQQDALLPDVEDGVVTFVGATTQNPFFAVNNALISRSQVFQFEALTSDDIEQLLRRAIADTTRGLGDVPIEISPEAIAFLSDASEGDARRALAALEIGVLSSSSRPVVYNLDLAVESLQRKAIQYDRSGDEHYDVASALIKSIRGSDPDASIYWLARMLEAGEEIRFISRRLVILASEDIGNADPQAMTIAVSCMHACEFVGLPECQFSLAQTVAYLACAPKSNAATIAISEARSDVQNNRVLPVPRHLKDGHYQGSELLKQGAKYQYAHDAPEGIVSQDYLGVDREYYRPVKRGFETELAERLTKIRCQLAANRPPKE